MRKTAIIAALVLLCQSIALPAVYAESDFSLRLTGGCPLPVGSKVRAVASGLPSGTEYVRFICSDEDGESELARVDASTAANTLVEYGEHTRAVAAYAYDAEDKLLGKSAQVEYCGMTEQLVEQIWDEDFDDAQISGAATAENPNGTEGFARVMRDGSPVTNMYSNTLEGYRTSGGTNDKSGIVEIKNSPEREGSSIYMECRDPGLGFPQFNGLWSTVKGDVGIVEMDYYFEDFNAERPLAELRSTGGWSGNSVRITTGGELVFGDGIMKVETGKWYKITLVLDFDRHTLACLVNDEFFAVASESISDIERIAMSNSGGLSKLWFDNYNVRRVKFINADEDNFEFSTAAGSILYSGEKVDFTIQRSGWRAAKNIEILESDGGKYEVIETLEKTAKSYTYSPVGSGTRYIKARLTDADGSVLCESAPTMLSAKAMSEVKSLWDVDFETYSLRRREAFTGDTNKTSAVLTTADGADASNENNEIMEAVTGSAANVIEIKAAPGGTRALSLYSEDAANMNMINSWRAMVNDFIACYSGDFMVEKEASVTNLMAIDCSGVAGAALAVAASGGKIAVKNNEGAILGTRDYEPGKWYNIKVYIDIPARRASCSIDGYSVAGTELSDTLAYAYRMSCGISGTAGARIWLDNFSVKQLYQMPEITDISASGEVLEVMLDSVIDKNTVAGASVVYGENEAQLTDISVASDRRSVALTARDKIFTQVPVTVKLKLADGNELAVTKTLAAAEFDVADVSFENGGKTARASIVNNTGSARSIVMLMSAYNAAGEIIGAYAAQAEIAPGGGTIEISADKACAYSKVFFINGWSDGSAAKNVVYRSDNVN